MKKGTGKIIVGSLFILSGFGNLSEDLAGAVSCFSFGLCLIGWGGYQRGKMENLVYQSKKIYLYPRFTKGQRQKIYEKAKQKWEGRKWKIVEHFDGGISKSSYMIIEKGDMEALKKYPQSLPLKDFFQNKKDPEKFPDIKLTVSINTSPSSNFDKPDTGEIIPSKDGGWIINPKSTFPLTIYGIELAVAEKFKWQIDQGFSLGSYGAVSGIMPLVTRHNIKCKEIDAYVKKFRPLYLEKIEEQKRNSSEWNTASELDKEDLLVEFQGSAIASLDIQPHCELETLFDGEAIDITIDDDLIEKFGYDTIRFYMNRKKGVHFIPADHCDREKFENLAEAGLSIQGDKIPLPAILESFKVKEMAALVAALNPPKFSKKNKALEYLEKIPDIKARVNKAVSMRTLFQLQSLPQEFAGIDLEKVSIAWKYAQEYSSLIFGTYMHSYYATRDFNNRKDGSDYITGYKISFAADDCCPYCKRMASKKYSKKQHPIVPHHIGCRCSVMPILKHE